MSERHSRTALFAAPSRVLPPVVAALLVAVLAGPAIATPVRFDPRTFFAGRTAGEGRLKVMLRASVGIRDEATGHIESDGSLSLAQVVYQEGAPPRVQQWHLRETAPGRFSGTMSGAKGPVTGELAGERLHLVYTSLDGLGYEQWLTPGADGRSARNILKVKKMGFTVAEVDETIRKLD